MSQPKVSRIYDDLSGLCEGLQAARLLGFREVTVTTVVSAAGENYGRQVRYHVELSEQPEARPQVVAS